MLKRRLRVMMMRMVMKEDDEFDHSSTSVVMDQWTKWLVCSITSSIRDLEYNNLLKGKCPILVGLSWNSPFTFMRVSTLSLRLQVCRRLLRQPLSGVGQPLPALPLPGRTQQRAALRCLLLPGQPQRTDSLQLYPGLHR